MEEPQSVQSPAISDEELKSLTNAIQQRHGIDFSCYEPKSLKRRVSRTLNVFKLNSVHELWIKILREHAFIYPFMDEISVGLTAMFRDPILWIKMRQLLTSGAFDTKPLSIWHAGCSTGEEVFTMGIVLRESLFAGKVNAWATDISKQAMETAGRGEYSKSKTEEYTSNYSKYNPAGTLMSHCRETRDCIVMDKSLIGHVSFTYHNLITDPVTSRFDVIFCRNVMIYFDTVAKQNLFNKFHQALSPGGLLIIGFYDAVFPLIDENKYRILDLDAKIFQKV